MRVGEEAERSQVFADTSELFSLLHFLELPNEIDAPHISSFSDLSRTWPERILELRCFDIFIKCQLGSELQLDLSMNVYTFSEETNKREIFSTLVN